MAIAYVAERGTLNITNGTGTTQAVTVATAPAAGNTIILVFSARRTITTGISVADSRGNTWTVDVGPLNTSNNLCLIASTRQDVAALQAADTVTITFTGEAPSALRFAVLEEFSGLLTSAGYVDKTASAGSASATSCPTGTTAATTQNDELAVAGWCLNGLASPTHDAAYSDFTTWTLQGTDGDTIAKTYAGQYKILSATGTQAATITRGAASSYQGMIVTYKAAAVATSLVIPRRSRRTALLRM